MILESRLLRSLVSLVLLVPLVFAPDAAAATTQSHGKSTLNHVDGKKKRKRVRKHRKHRRRGKRNRKTNGGVR